MAGPGGRVSLQQQPRRSGFGVSGNLQAAAKIAKMVRPPYPPGAEGSARAGDGADAGGGVEGGVGGAD